MKVFISVLMFGIVISSAAQNEKKEKWHDKKENFLPSVTRSIGASFQQFNGLNARVAAIPQYKQLKDHAFTLGLGWMKEQQQVVTAGNIYLGSSMSGHHDEESSTVHYLGLDANIGYNVIKSTMVSLYPFGGLGFQFYRAIFFRDNSQVNFDNVLQSPVVQNSISAVRFNNAFFIYRAGIGVAFKSPEHPSNSIGIQAGYTGSFNKRAWRSNEGQQLANAPEDRVSQFFVSLVLTSKPWMMMRK
ncbi:MAG: hypothetical protein ABUT20_24110 [Bacteroidota bacterium]